MHEFGRHADFADESLARSLLCRHRFERRGELINGDQTLPRDEALRLYTAANRWFLREDDLGSIERPAPAPTWWCWIVITDEVAVSDEEIKQVRSLLTLVGGNIVHGDPADL